MVTFLSQECGWPIDEDLIKHVAWEVSNESLGINEEYQINEIKVYELRPLTGNQPWGVFFVSVDGTDRLSVTLLRRLLKALVKKKRATTSSSKIKQFDLSDLMFVCSLNKNNQLTRYFAHFRDQSNGLPKLLIGSRWDQNQSIEEVKLARQKLVSGLTWPEDITDLDGWREKWSKAFKNEYKGIINSTSKLTEALASAAKNVKKMILEVHGFERDNGPITTLFEAVEKGLISGIKIGEFSDMIAQTVTYGLFSIRATSETDVSIESLAESVQNTNPFLREFMIELKNLSGNEPGDLDFDELGLNDLINLLNETDIDSIFAEFGTQFKGGLEDPVIHFYETFLRAYDSELKIERGVFYTPKPAVDFIVRGIHTKLKNEYGISHGLANVETHNVSGQDYQKILILDPAVGTGTFLVSVIETIHSEMTTHWKQERMTSIEIKNHWNDYVNEFLFDKLYGFELMMAPYSISHLKIGLTLKRTGYEFKNKKRLRIFLANTLEPPSELSNWLPNFLTNEAALANSAKSSVPFSVVLGNPPYSGHSKNNSKFIKDLVDDYKRGFPDLSRPGQGKWLQDDYVKFFRISQKFLEQSEIRMLGFITNHGFLDNPTFKGMRKFMMQQFENIDLYDLDGNSNKNTSKEDENIFEIKQGVSIAFLSGQKMGEGNINHVKINAKREEKLKMLKTDEITDKLISISPSEPFYMFSNIDLSISNLYSRYYSIPDIFSEISKPAPGIVTTHDQFAIAFSSEEMKSKVNSFLSTKNESDARDLFRLCTQNQWNYSNAKHALSHMPWEEKIVPLLQRPYDVRYTVYDPNVAVHLRKRITTMMLGNLVNFGLITSRRLEVSKPWSHIFSTDKIIQHHSVSTKEVNYLFPLYSSCDKDTRRTNISEDLLRSINESRKDGVDFSAENLFMYVYGILHSDLYRNMFDQELRIDWPRIPIWKNVEIQNQIASIGQTIFDAQVNFEKLQSVFIPKVSSHDDLKKVSYGDEEIKLDNKLAYVGVTQDLWLYEIGGAQIIKKYLTDRKGRCLSKSELVTLGKILTSIQIVIDESKNLDHNILGGRWPDNLAFFETITTSQTKLF
jgi:hypothetical protein